MRVDEAYFGNAILKSTNLAHRTQADHVPRMDRIAAAAGTPLARIRDFKSRIHERLQHPAG